MRCYNFRYKQVFNEYNTNIKRTNVNEDCAFLFGGCPPALQKVARAEARAKVGGEIGTTEVVP